ncbi:MAG: CPBP family glutamic-type intramembrane protease [Pseudomonadota bacterium]
MARSPKVARRRRLGAFALVALGVACACAGLISFEIPTNIVLETGLKPYQLKTLSIIQVSLLSLIAAGIGYWATPQLGLRSIIVDGIPPFGASMLIFLFIGMVCGIAFGFIDMTLTKQLPLLGSFQSAHEAQLTELEALATPMMRLAYGGVTEEILTRYGLLSGVAMTANTLLKRRLSALGLAIILSSVVFGLGHLPAIMAFVPDAPTIFLAKTVLLNAAIASLFAVVFVLHSLEASMATHIGFHLTLIGIG